ncbi:hypothetical protein [Flavobacterium sp.]|uniref:hypothetical protein n=1 Tax=Flavobacterium sp. TaxID=239 RepID=UPI00286E377F|nr:hypothetical protein [Flavobacterium sp.]
MKSNNLIILFVFVFNIAFSQEKKESSIVADSNNIVNDSTQTKLNYEKWIIDIGTGVSNGTRPYTDGYFTSVNNQLFNGFVLNCYTVGARHNFSKIIGIKMDLAFDRFINSEENKSKPFEVAQYRTSFQGLFNLNSLVKTKNDISRFNILVHAGVHLAMLKPIAADYNKKVSNGDNYGGIVFGITPTLKISKKTAFFVDFNSFNNYGQNLTWNGKHTQDSNNTDGHMYSITFGLSFVLDKKQM